jgi:hypothetical protein
MMMAVVARELEKKKTRNTRKNTRKEDAPQAPSKKKGAVFGTTRRNCNSRNALMCVSAGLQTRVSLLWWSRVVAGKPEPRESLGEKNAKYPKTAVYTRYATVQLYCWSRGDSFKDTIRKEKGEIPRERGRDERGRVAKRKREKRAHREKTACS